MAGQPKYPIYIVSKGRAYNPMTAKIFEGAGIDYFIVVEPQEADEYAAALSKERVLVLPFSNKGLGSFPARNWCWEHAIANGHKKHWVFDDNICVFNKCQPGGRRKAPSVKDAIIYVETFSDSNDIDISGFEKKTFSTRPPKKPFKINCHVYSTLLIKNSLPYRWRLKYNEDIDLCLQVLHNGGGTASCVYYLAEKVSTSDKMKGGNQTELYQGNDPKKKLLKAKMLQSVWPQYVKVVIRFGRFHHLINWKVFNKKTNKNTVEIR